MVRLRRSKKKQAVRQAGQRVGNRPGGACPPRNDLRTLDVPDAVT